jgi:calcium/calmodulin-dependent protein kinase I
VEHDLAIGLRENFDPRARWRSAIIGARALNRLRGLGTGSSSSGKGWINGNDDDDDDDEEEEEAPGGGGRKDDEISDAGLGPESKMKMPGLGLQKTHDQSHVAAATSTELATARLPLTGPEAHESPHEDKGSDPAMCEATEEQPSVNRNASRLTSEEEEEIQMPGSFDMSNPRQKSRDGGDTSGDEEDDKEAVSPWSFLFRRMKLSS